MTGGLNLLMNLIFYIEREFTYISYKLNFRLYIAQINVPICYPAAVIYSIDQKAIKYNYVLKTNKQFIYYYIKLEVVALWPYSIYLLNFILKRNKSPILNSCTK